MRMPEACAAQNGPGLGTAYDLRVFKGLSPFAVRAWPFCAEGCVQFGERELPALGVEENNGHRLFARAGFEPRYNLLQILTRSGP